MIALSLKHAGFGITDEAYMKLVYDTIQKNKFYIYKLCRGDATKIDDVSSRVLVHAITHRDYSTDNLELDAYINVLAKYYLTNICSEQNKQAEYDDGYQNTLSLSTTLLPSVAGCDSEGRYAIEDALVHYYFKYPDDVRTYCYNTLKLLGIKMYTAEPVDENAPPHDKRAWNTLLQLMKRYDAVTVLNATLAVANRISAQEHKMHRRKTIAPLCACEIDYDTVDDIIAGVTAIARVGKKEVTLRLDPYTLCMQDVQTHKTVNLDVVKWQPVQKSVTTVIALDMTGLLEYLYTQICVPEGVDTKFIRWLGKRNIKTLPGGTQLEDVSVEQYMLEAKTELLCALVSAKISNVLGMTEDTIYYSPRKRVTYDNIKYLMRTGIVVDLPVHVTNVGLE